jgi:CheY-like chemotaxis protein
MGSEKILVIDDEHTLLRLSQILLQKKGFDVSVALSAREGRAFLGANPPVDMIVLDLMMPEENGFDFLNWKLDQEEPIKSIPVIVNTAKNLSEDEKTFLEANTVKIMQKGVQFTDRLVGEVEGALSALR